MTQLGDLLLSLKLDVSSFEASLEGAKASAMNYGRTIETSIGKTKVSLKPIVDDSALTALNKHLSLKQTHATQVQAWFDSNPLKPRVDLSGLRSAENEIRQFERSRSQVTIKSTSKVAIAQGDLSGLESSVSGAITKGFNKASEGNPIGGLIKAATKVAISPITVPLALASNAASSIAQGLVLGVTQTLGNTLGKGLNTALESALSGVGGIEVMGEALGEVLSLGIVDAATTGLDELPGQIEKVINKIPKILEIVTGGIPIPQAPFQAVGRGAKSLVRDEVRDLKRNAQMAGNLGAEVIGDDRRRDYGLEVRSRKRQSAENRRPEAEEQANIERRDALRAYEDQAKDLAKVQAFAKKNALPMLQLEKQAKQAVKAQAKVIQELPQDAPTAIKKQAMADYKAREKELTETTKDRKMVQMYHPERIESMERNKKQAQDRLVQIDARKAELSAKGKPLTEAEQKETETLTQRGTKADLLIARMDEKLEKEKQQINAAKEAAKVAREQFESFRDAHSELYRQAIKDITGIDLPDGKMPQLIADDARLNKRRSRGSYSAETNRIYLKQASIDQIKANTIGDKTQSVLDHELGHGKQFDFGSARGVRGFKTNTPVTPLIEMDAAMIAENQEFLAKYAKAGRDESEFPLELDAEEGARRARKRRQSKPRAASIKAQVQGQIVIDEAKASVKDTFSSIESQSARLERIGVEAPQTRKIIENLKSQSAQLVGMLVDRKKMLESIHSMSDSEAASLVVQIGVIRDKVVKNEVLVKQLFPQVTKGEIVGEVKAARQAAMPVPKSAMERVGDIATGAKNAIFNPDRNIDIDMDKAAEMAQGIGAVSRGVFNAAQAALEATRAAFNSPIAKSIGRSISAGAQVVGGAAQVGYKGLEAAEALALDIVPMGRSAKAIGQQVVLPALAFNTAAGLFPGGHAVAGGLMDMASNAIAPAAHGMAGGLSGQAADFIGHAVPNVMGLQGSITGALTGAIDGAVGQIASHAAQIGVAVLGGKALTGAAAAPIKALLPAMPELKKTPALMPARELEAVELVPETKAKLKAMSAGTILAPSTPTIEVKAMKSAAVDVPAIVVEPKPIEDYSKGADAIVGRFKSTYNNAKQALASSDFTSAREYIKQITQLASDAQDDIAKFVAALGDGAAMGTEAGNRLNGIKGAIGKYSNNAKQLAFKIDRAETKAMKSAAPDDDLDGGLDSLGDVAAKVKTFAKEQLPAIAKEMPVAAAGFMGSHALTGSVGSGAAGLVATVGARYGINAAQAGGRAHDRLKEDELFKASSAMEKFRMMLNETSIELSKGNAQDTLGSELSGDLIGTALAQLPGIAGPIASIAVTPQLVKLRERVTAKGNPSVEIEPVDQVAIAKKAVISAAGYTATHLAPAGMGSNAATVAKMGARAGATTVEAGIAAHKTLSKDEVFQASSALERFKMMLDQVSRELGKKDVQAALGDDLSSDLISSILGQMPGDAGGLAAIVATPQLVKLREKIQSRLQPEEDPLLAGGLDSLNPAGDRANKKNQDLLKALEAKLSKAIAQAKNLEGLDQSLGGYESANAKNIEMDEAFEAMGPIKKPSPLNKAQQRQMRKLERQAQREAIKIQPDPYEAVKESMAAIGTDTGGAPTGGGLLGGLKAVGIGFISFQVLSTVIPMLGAFVTKAIEANRALSNLKTAMDFASGGSRKAASDLAFVGSTVEELKIPLAASREGFKSLAASTKGTSIEGDSTRDIFTGMSQATTVLGLSAEQQAQTMTALSQMAGKGVVSMEELRGQMDALPGSFNIAARAMGMTTAELDKLVSSGNLRSEDFLPKFGRQLQAEFGGSAKDAAKNAQSAQFNAENQGLQVQEKFGAAIEPAVITYYNAMAGALSGVNFAFSKMGALIAASGLTGLRAMLVGATGNSVALSAVLSKIGPTLISTLSAIGPMLLKISVSLLRMAPQMLVFNAAIEVGRGLMEAFMPDDLTNKFTGFTDQSVSGLDRVAAAADKAAGKVAGITPKAPTELKSKGIDLSLGLGGMLGFDGTTDGVIKAMRNIPGLGGMSTLGEKQFSDQKVAAGDLAMGAQNIAGSTLGGAFTTTDGSQVSIAGQIKKVKEADDKIKAIDLERQKLQLNGNPSKLAMDSLTKQKQELMKERDIASAPIVEQSTQIDAQIKNIKKALEEIDAQGFPADKAKELKAQLLPTLTILEKAQSRQEIFNRKLSEAASLAAQFGDNWQRALDQKADAEKSIDMVTAAQKTALTTKAADGTVSQGTASFSGAVIDNAGISSKLLTVIGAIAKQQQLMQSVGAKETLAAAGISETAGTAELTTKEKNTTDPRVKQAIKAQIDTISFMEQKAALEGQLSESSSAMNNQLREASKAAADFYRGIARGNEDLLTTLKDMRLDTALSDTKNRIKGALKGFHDTFIGDFANKIIEMMELTTQMAKNDIEAQNQIISRIRAIEDTRRQGAEMLQAAPQVEGGVIGGGGGVSLTDTTASGGTFDGVVIEKLFAGRSNSIIAKVVGMAEGNRTADGGYTRHAKGHVDPNNGAYNIGSFSAQGNLNDGTVEGSDARVMNNLLKPAIGKLQSAANTAGVQVTSKILFNYIDLLNQAPDAATGWNNGKGFIGNIGKLKGRENDDAAIRNVRAEGFRNNSGRLETTFNGLAPLERDQQRRMDEINKAITAFSSQLPSGNIAAPRVNIAPPQRIATQSVPMGKSKMQGSISGRLDGSGQNGADMDVGPNGELYSYHNGTVSELGRAGNNGNYVVIEYLDDLGNKLEATYSHIGAIVKKGQQVIGGQVLGKFDASGRTFGAHNSIDINTPGTNGALQRNREGSAAKRGADLLVKGIVQGSGGSSMSSGQTTASSIGGNPATQAQQEAMQAAAERSNGVISKGTELASKNFDQFKTNLLAKTQSTNQGLAQQIQQMSQRATEGLKRSTQDQTRERVMETRANEDREFTIGTMTPDRQVKKDLLGVSRSREDFQFNAQRDGSKAMDTYTQALEVRTLLQRAKTEKSIPDNVVDPLLKEIQKQIPQIKKNLDSIRAQSANASKAFAAQEADIQDKAAIALEGTRLEADRRIGGVNNELRGAQSSQALLLGDFEGSQALNRSSAQQDININLRSQLLEIKTLAREQKITADEADRLKTTYQDVASIKLQNITTELRKQREELKFSSAAQLLDSRMGLAKANTEGMRFSGNELGAREQEHQGAIAQNNFDLTSQTRQIDNAVKSGQLLASTALEMKANLGELSKVQLKNLENQFNPEKVMNGQAIKSMKDGVKGALQGLFSGDGIDFTAILKKLSDSAADMLSTYLTDKLFGSKKGVKTADELMGGMGALTGEPAKPQGFEALVKQQPIIDAAIGAVPVENNIAPSNLGGLVVDQADPMAQTPTDFASIVISAGNEFAAAVKACACACEGGAGGMGKAIGSDKLQIEQPAMSSVFPKGESQFTMPPAVQSFLSKGDQPLSGIGSLSTSALGGGLESGAQSAVGILTQGMGSAGQLLGASGGMASESLLGSLSKGLPTIMGALGGGASGSTSPLGAIGGLLGGGSTPATGGGGMLNSLFSGATSMTGGGAAGGAGGLGGLMGGMGGFGSIAMMLLPLLGGLFKKKEYVSPPKTEARIGRTTYDYIKKGDKWYQDKVAKPDFNKINAGYRAAKLSNFADGNLTSLAGGVDRGYMRGIPSPMAIQDALQREGPGGVVSVLKTGELVLSPTQTQAFFARGMDKDLKIPNYATGNMDAIGVNYAVNAKIPKFAAGGLVTNSQSIEVNTPITVNGGGGGGADIQGFKAILDARINQIIREQQRDGGTLQRR